MVAGEQPADRLGSDADPAGELGLAQSERDALVFD